MLPVPEFGGEAAAYVARNRAAASALGTELAQLIDDPERFVNRLMQGLRALSDAGYVETVDRVSPGTGSELSVRGPLVSAIQRPLRRRLRASAGSSALWLAQRLARCPERELRIFAQPCLERSLKEDPERSWQLMRQLGGRAGDWIEVDSLADVWALGVLAESYRWAELEQLVYSRLTMERRLVGATLARLPHRLPRAQRGTLRHEAWTHALGLLHQSIGDAEPMVQKSLSWAIREWRDIDAAGMQEFLRQETSIAVAGEDGSRAWVIRDALSNQPAGFAAELRSRLKGVRRKPGAASTSIAAGQAAAYALALEPRGAVGMQGERFTRSHP